MDKLLTQGARVLFAKNASGPKELGIVVATHAEDKSVSVEAEDCLFCGVAVSVCIPLAEAVEVVDLTRELTKAREAYQVALDCRYKVGSKVQVQVCHGEKTSEYQGKITSLGALVHETKKHELFGLVDVSYRISSKTRAKKSRTVSQLVHEDSILSVSCEPAPSCGPRAKQARRIAQYSKIV